jgi:hypothetical protein
MGKLFIGIGVGPGLGASTAERFAQEGFDILLTATGRLIGSGGRSDVCSCHCASFLMQLRPVCQ